MSYVGRFAPSPSGSLHFGSLVTALGSFLQAKANQGKWLVRIEDIDPLREVQGASSLILKTLDAFKLHWDNQVEYQSTRTDLYLEKLNLLLNKQLAYYCDCTRKRMNTLLDHGYDGFCRDRGLMPKHQELAVRLKQAHPIYQFHDHIRGVQKIASPNAQEDFIIHRKSGLFAYNLVVVLDDYQQGITEIVRGADLLATTAKQISLYRLFNWQIPSYCHLPLVLDKYGNKLSKQNHAKPVSLSNIQHQTVKALYFLNQIIPDDWQDASQDELLKYAIKQWDIKRIPTHDVTVTDELATNK